MKKIYSIILLAAALISLIPLSTSCKKDDGNAVELEVFGPCPVLRGSTISFIGKNLDRVTSITFPNAIEVTEITKNSSTEIIAPVPQEATEGKLILNYPGGSITTTSSIGFTEPYEIKSISPTDKAIRCGDVVTISGDYLWNIVSVVFMSAAEVDSSLFTSQTRTQISVPVPADAQSGKIKIVDVSGNELYSDAELTISQPSVTAVAPLEVKAGKEITITGTNIDLIESVTFTSNKEVVIELPERSQTSVKVSVPADAQDGKISYKSYAGISAEFGTPITLTVPSELSVTAPDGFKADKLIVIAGKDLDLVTAVTFSGNVDGTYTYLPEDGTIIVPIDPTAQDGVITLTTAAGKTVETEAVTFVKPVITSMAPLSLTAGETFTVLGTDLNLTTCVTLGGKSCTYTIDSEGQLTVQTENTSVSGKVVVTIANGITTESTDEITLSYNSRIIVNSLPSVASAGDEITITGENFNMIESIFFGETKVTGYSQREDALMKFIIPAETETGIYNIKFLLTTGEEENCPATIEVKGATMTVVVWEGSHSVGTSWGNAFTALSWGTAFNKIPYGASIHVEYTTNNDEATYYQIQILNGNWSPLECFPCNEWNVVEVASGSTHVSYELTANDVATLYTTGLVLGGYALTYTKVYYTYENQGKEPIRYSDVMLMDYEVHGGHSGDWDGSWGGLGAKATESNGNNYFQVTAEGNGWYMNCNHQANVNEGGEVSSFKVDDVSKYYLAVDVMAPQGWSDPGTINYQLVLGDGWCWYGANLFSGIVGNGKWQTVLIDPAVLGLSGEKDCSSGTNGLFTDGSSTGVLPIGMGLDNLRFILK